ncbi:hypothetical protein [Streptomyces sp. NPDC050535]|uniref:hypothetical protein n=1 Tax=Streptomyces sp. NPDC050535 TaxID=3365626 RepID=UPI0037A63D74
MRLSRIPKLAQVTRVSRAGKVWVSAGVAATVAGAALTAALVTGSGTGGESTQEGSGRADSGSADEAQRTAMALTRFRTSRADGPSEVTVRLPSSEAGTVTVRGVADHRLHRAVGVYEVTEDGHSMRGLLAWDLESIAVAGSPAAAPDTALGPEARPEARPAAPGPVTTAVQAARRAATLKSGQWKRRPYGTAPLDRALHLALSVAADRPGGTRLPVESRRLWPRAPRPEGSAAAPEASALAQTYSLDAAGDLRRVTADVAPGRKATVDFATGRARTGVPGAPWG